MVKSTNNNYYLNHAFDKSYNTSGSIFADYRNHFDKLDKNTVIYGHNRKNGNMFSNLNYTLEEIWYKYDKNQFINFDTPSQATVWQIFSMYQATTKNVINPISFSSDTDFSNFVQTVKGKSIYDFNVAVDKDDKILTLYTCGNNTAYRVIIHAKLVYQKSY